MSLYLIKHRILIRMRFIDIKSLHVRYYLPFDRLMGLWIINAFLKITSITASGMFINLCLVVLLLLAGSLVSKFLFQITKKSWRQVSDIAQFHRARSFYQWQRVYPNFIINICGYISQAIFPNFKMLSPQQYKRSFNIEFKMKDRLATVAEEGTCLIVE